jgi:hypothetical protein
MRGYQHGEIERTPYRNKGRTVGMVSALVLILFLASFTSQHGLLSIGRQSTMLAWQRNRALQRLLESRGDKLMKRHQLELKTNLSSDAPNPKGSSAKTPFRRGPIKSNFNGCTLYQLFNGNTNSSKKDTGIQPLPLTANYYFNDSLCSEVGGWSIDPNVSPSLFSTNCDLDRIDATKIDPAVFVRSYLHHRPVILVDPSGLVLRKLKMYLETITKSSLYDTYGHSQINTVRTGLTDGNYDPNRGFAGSTIALREYLERMQKPWSPYSTDDEEATDYLLFGDTKGTTDTDDRNFRSRAAHAPFPLAKHWIHRASEDKPHRRLLALGGVGSGTPFHQHEATWAALYYGMKRWFLRPPSVQSWYSFNVSEVGVTTKHRRKTTLEWYLSADKDGYAQLRKDPESLLECVQVPGEIFYVPGRWWHATVNVAESFLVAQFDSTTKSGPNPV